VNHRLLDHDRAPKVANYDFHDSEDPNRVLGDAEPHETVIHFLGGSPRDRQRVRAALAVNSTLMGS
jgi:hypothetical protein